MAQAGTHPAHTAPVTRPDSRRYVDLARGMGIPAHDAARQVMDLIASRAKLAPCGSNTRTS